MHVTKLGLKPVSLLHNLPEVLFQKQKLHVRMNIRVQLVISKYLRQYKSAQ